MNRFQILASVLLSTSTVIWAAPKQDTESWIDASVKAKSELLAKLKEAGMPVISQWVKHKQKAQPFSVDVKGLEKLVLVTAGGPDGTDYDQAVWANARLIKADGTEVWLDEIPYEYGVAGWAKPKMNTNAYDHEIIIDGKEYKHGVFCHANGTLVYPLNGEYVRFEAEVGIDDSSSGGSVFFQALNVMPGKVGEALNAKYPNEISMLGSVLDGLDSWLITADASVEKQAVEKALSHLKDKTYFAGLAKQIESETDVNTQIHKYLELLEQIQNVATIQDELAWLNVDAIQKAYTDMSKRKGYDKAKYEPMLKELLALNQKGFNGIYKGDQQAMADARKALANKRAILLGNTLLDKDKIVATRFKLGVKARQAMAPDLGTQANNWSNQESARRGGFDAEIVELSNLRGDTVNMRQVYKAQYGSSIADLKLHWDGDRVMFTQLMPDKRWNIHEVKLDGTGYHPLLEMKEPD